MTPDRALNGSERNNEYRDYPGPRPAAVDTLRILAFGFVVTLISSFGQTFFVGLFSTVFSSAANIGGTTLSLFFEVATLASGNLLFWVGSAMHRIPYGARSRPFWSCSTPAVSSGPYPKTGAMRRAAFFGCVWTARACSLSWRLSKRHATAASDAV